MSRSDYWRIRQRYVTLRRVNAKLPSWDASGKVEAAWKRLDPPTQEELAKRLGIKARTNLSHMNRGTMLMSPDYANRIVAVVPGLTVADLGAPEAVVAAEAPAVLDRLAALEAELDLWKGLLLEALTLLGLQAIPEADQGSRVRRRAARATRAGGSRR